MMNNFKFDFGGLVRIEVGGAEMVRYVPSDGHPSAFGLRVVQAARATVESASGKTQRQRQVSLGTLANFVNHTDDYDIRAGVNDSWEYSVLVDGDKCDVAVKPPLCGRHGSTLRGFESLAAFRRWCEEWSDE